MVKPLEIALAFPRGSNQEVFIEGILKYVNEHGRRWSFVLAPESNSITINQLVGWTGDAVIAALNTPAEARCAKSYPLPIVNISSALEESPVPRTMVDNYAVGVMAAEHLLGRAYEHFAYYGIKGVAYSEKRLHGFQETLEAAGYVAEVHLADPTFKLKGSDWCNQQAALSTWIEQLTQPCGVLAASDARARQVVSACRQIEIQVPNQIAVIGVDDQQIICEHTHPTLTSVARNSIREGCEAAAMLDRMLSGDRVEVEDRLVAPLGVVTRESTDMIAVQDERLRDALVYLRENIESPVTVGQMCKRIGVSRRWLEYAFTETLGLSPYCYIRKQRLEHARQLLREEHNTAINTIATRTGYTSSTQLAKAFREAYGLSPRGYRKSLSTNGQS